MPEGPHGAERSSTWKGWMSYKKKYASPIADLSRSERSGTRCFNEGGCRLQRWHRVVGSRGREARAHRDGEESPRHLHHRSMAEVAGEERDVDGGRHENDLEVRPPGQQATQDTQQEVVVQVPLMDLVHNQDLVLGQGGLPLDLA